MKIHLGYLGCSLSRDKDNKVAFNHSVQEVTCIDCIQAALTHWLVSRNPDYWFIKDHLIPKLKQLETLEFNRKLSKDLDK